MTLREIKDILQDWFSSGFCNLFHANLKICDFYGRDWWDLTISQSLFTGFIIWFALAMGSK
jgi:hypothetical protein